MHVEQYRLNGEVHYGFPAESNVIFLIIIFDSIVGKWNTRILLYFFFFCFYAPYQMPNVRWWKMHSPFGVFNSFPIHPWVNWNSKLFQYCGFHWKRDFFSCHISICARFAKPKWQIHIIAKHHHRGTEKKKRKGIINEC